MNKILITVLLPLILIHPQARKIQKDHNFSGTVPISLVGLMTISQTDYKISQAGFGAIGTAEYFFPTYSSTFYGVRFFLGGQNLKGKDDNKTPSEFVTDMIIFGGGLTAGYSLNDKIFPYVFAGVSNVWFSPKDVSGKRLENNTLGIYSRTTLSYEAQVGSRLALTDVLSLSFSFGFHFPQTDNYDDVTKGSFNDFYYTGQLGITLSLFGSKDTDGDGITDSEDACPNSPEDNDGFQDEDGCPDYDNDGDGIPDTVDKCPNEPEDFDGFEDDDGCPDLDNDRDGIHDSLDKCPNEPENFNGYEDEDGCPDILSNLLNLPDRDKDGIPDESDKCPDEPETFNGFQDEDGCPDTAPSTDTVSVNEFLLEGNLLFDYRGYDLKAESFQKIDKIADFLIQDPFIKWAVESYTDDSGDPDSLKALAQMRAITLVRYFVDKGLPSFMFKIFSFGAESPIADNKTLEGRLKNNRIVIKKRY